MKIGILIVATNKYLQYVTRLRDTINQLFLRDHEKHIFVFTDRVTEVPDGTIPCYVKHEPWPAGSSRRFYFFDLYKPLLSTMDHLFYFDADMEVVSEVKDEVLGDGITATLHKVWLDKTPDQLPYCRDKKSLSCVQQGEGKNYFCGGFWGGRNKEFFDLCKCLMDRTEVEIEQGYYPINYDESHLNRYLIDNPPAAYMPWQYCSHPKYKAEAKIMALIKDHGELRGQGDHVIAGRKTNGNRVIFINYTNRLYRKMQPDSCENALKVGFKHIVAFTDTWLETREYYFQNKKILDLKRGAGYWVWKPYIILGMLEYMSEKDILVYGDVADVFSPGFVEFIAGHVAANGIFLVRNTPFQKHYCKRDAFVLPGYDTPEYHELQQLEAGIIGVTKTPQNIAFLKEWFFLCQNENLVTDKPNECGQPNFPGFVDHRHDQSLLTMVAHKHNMPAVPLDQVAWKYIAYDQGKVPREYMGGRTLEEVPDWRKILHKYNLPEDFGPNHPWFTQPSYKYRWNQMVAEYGDPSIKKV